MVYTMESKAETFSIHPPGFGSFTGTSHGFIRPSLLETTMRRRQRKAINQARIQRQFKSLGPLLQGHRAFREGKSRGSNPHSDESEERWFRGWDFAKEKADE